MGFVLNFCFEQRWEGGRAEIQANGSPPRRDAEESSKVRAPTVMKTFEQSLKSQKTVKCMIETRGEKPKEKVKNKKNKGSKKDGELRGKINGKEINIPEERVAACAFAIRLELV